MLYDLLIIGGGPAGVAGGVYAARKKLKTVVLAETFGGQSVVSADIQNWIGTPSISGEKLAEDLKAHLFAYRSTDFVIAEGARITKLAKNTNGNFVATASDNKEYTGRAVLIATGAHRRKLEVPGAAEFEQKGITYCASCDGPLFSDKDVIVIGGGNAGFETAAQLLAYCKSVTLLHYNNNPKADQITIDKIKQNPKMKIILNAVTKSVTGDKFVSALQYTDAVTKQEFELKAEGIFVEIGLVPTTDFAASLVDLTDYKTIVTDPRTQATSVPGVYAAGDCTDATYHQNNIAAGDAVKALEHIYQYLHRQG